MNDHPCTLCGIFHDSCCGLCSFPHIALPENGDVCMCRRPLEARLHDPKLVDAWQRERNAFLARFQKRRAKAMTP